MIKPEKLQKGDTVAIVSLSSGIAGDKNIKWRTLQGIKRLKEVFGLHVKIMPHALKGSEYVYNNPEKRAEDFNNAIRDKSIKGIICCTGGSDSIRLMPFIDFKSLKENPKIFCGYSDTTVQHLLFYLNGISTSYGPALLTDFAENVEMDHYTSEWVNKAWFNTQPLGKVETSPYYREFGLLWDPENELISRRKIKNGTYESINGDGKVQGHLLGGSLEVLSNLRGTEIFPSIEHFKSSIFFLETSESYIEPSLLEDYLRTFAVMGIFNQVNGVIVGKPQNSVYYEEYKHAWKKIMNEFKLYDLPILYNASFGHNEPKCIIPYGLRAEIDTYKKSFSILESSVV